MMEVSVKLQKEQELVLFQLLSTDPNLKLLVGANNAETYNREQIIEHVQELDDVGRDYIETQMNFMRAVSSGEMFEKLNKHLHQSA